MGRGERGTLLSITSMVSALWYYYSIYLELDMKTLVRAHAIILSMLSSSNSSFFPSCGNELRCVTCTDAYDLDDLDDPDP